ncbi:restriction endonuclease subunit S (plasmid) [Shewanella decolorationis]|uniref:Restriction endonuclease subunit S n=1 Tax=Shewanella decolorationis TaxID=256839 RepID=A0A5B8R232_9GAMM|nr:MULTISPECIES: restriction endonuclease subunit S [Shewanella]QWY79370.1 restriction endonuclease subunit S [Shewanella decolorationis]
MRVEKNVPEIRFEGFSGEWEEKVLEDICDVRDGTHASPKYQQNGFPLVTSKNVKNGYINYDDVQYISKIDFDEINKRSKVDVNDILIGMIGTIGNIALIRQTPDFAIKNVALIKDKNEMDFLYSYYFLQSPITTQQLDDFASGGTQKFISLSNVRSLLICVPEREEQTAIGNTFQKLDSLINQHQQKHDKLSNIKKAMLEKMFPKQGETMPEIRFKGFSGEWEVKPLSEVAEVIDPHPSHRAPDAVENGVPFIGIGDISDSGLVDFKNVRIVPLHIYNEHSARYTIENGDFAYGRVASVGKIIDLSNNVGNRYTYSPTMAIVKPKSLRPAFLKSYLGTDVFKAHVDNKTSGSTRKSLGVQDFRNLPVLFPLVDEQTAIGSYFQKLDTLVNQHQQQITKLNNIKQACLSKMFV